MACVDAGGFGYKLNLHDASLEMSPSAVGQLRAVEHVPPT